MFSTLMLLICIYTNSFVNDLEAGSASSRPGTALLMPT